MCQAGLWPQSHFADQAPRAELVLKVKLKQRAQGGCPYASLMPTFASFLLHLFSPEPEEMGKGYFKIYNYGRSNHQN